MLAGSAAAVVRQPGCALWSAGCSPTPGWGATLGAVGLAGVCALIFVGVLRLTAPQLLAQLWSLRRSRPPAEAARR